MREFLYLNEVLVDQFLAQVDDGLWDEQQERERRTGERKGGGSVGIKPVKVDGKLGSERESEQSRTRRQTPESRFNRLANLVSDTPDDRPIKIDADVTNAYSQLSPGRLASVECYVDVPSIGRAIAQADQMQGLLDLMTTFAPDQVSAADREAIQGIGTIAQNMSNDVICTGEVDEEMPTFVFRLARKFLRVEMGELEGEAIVFGNVHRKWPEGDSYPILAVPGLDLMSRADRRKMKANAKKEDEEVDLQIEGPGITLSPVAVFRGHI
jgi:hypothetical protein